MTRIYVFKNPAAMVSFFIIFGGLFTISGIFLLIKAFNDGFNTNFQNGDWNSVLFTFLGIIFMFQLLQQSTQEVFRQSFLMDIHEDS